MVDQVTYCNLHAYYFFTMSYEIRDTCLYVHEKLKFLWHELAWMAGGVYSVPSKSYDIKAVCL